MKNQENEEKIFKFTREATCIEFGYVTAKNAEEARQKVAEGEYDDIYDIQQDDPNNDTIEIEGEDE